MKPKTQKQLTQEIWQGMYGIDGTEDKGFLGDFKELKEEVKEINGRVNKLSTRLKVLYAFLGGLGILGGGLWGIFG